MVTLSAVSVLIMPFVALCAAQVRPLPADLAPESPQTVESTTKRPSGPATYWVTFSTSIRPGMTVPVSVRLLKDGVTSTVSVTLRNTSDNSVLASAAPQTLSGGGVTHTINLQIPQTLKQPDYRYGYGWYGFAIRVEGSGDVTFNKSSDVSLSDKAFSIFVQTDKAIYKPGQTVKLRALAMNPDLTVMTEPMDVFIRDPNGNGIKQWKGVTGVSNTGVIELSMPTSDQPPLGDWTIEVTVKGQKESKTFTVDEYVLPKFEAKVDIPKYMLTTDPQLTGTASGKYTFGKPLTDANVLVTAKLNYYYSGDGAPQPTLTRTGKLDSKGEFKFTFTNEEFLDLAWKTFYNYPNAQRQYLSLDYRTLQIIANVTDVRTGHKMGSDAELTFKADPAKVEFLPISSSSYKPGLKYTAHLSVTKHDDSVFENPSSIMVTFNVTMYSNKPTTTTTTTTTTTATNPPSTSPGQLTMMKPGRYPFHPGWDWEPELEEILLEKQVPLTANGFIALEFDIPAHAKRISIMAEALKTKAYSSANRAASPSDNFLQLAMTSQNAKVGQSASFAVKITEPVQKIIYQVYAKGTVVKSEEVASSVATGSASFVLSFVLTANMAPNCRVLVFYFRPDGEVVADSMSFKVDAASDNPVTLEYSKKQVKPGEEVDLTIRAKPSSVVFMLGIDKSVKLLKSGNDITQEMVTEQLIGYDYGFGFHGFWRYMVICGWPYPSQGSDAYSVFNGANVAIFTDGDVYQQTFNYHYRGAVMMMASAPMEDSGSGFGGAAAGAPDLPVERVRSFFPETWLWDLVILGAEGMTIQTQVAPDTITTWLTTAFAVHPQFGLSVLPEAAELTTFRDTFVSLDLPYSAIRGEDLCMKAFAFNYFTEPLFMTMTMDKTDGISHIRMLKTSRSNSARSDFRIPMRISHRIGSVAPDTVGETVFCFQPTQLGYLPIRVNLTNTRIPGDGVERMLLVEPEGLPRVQSSPVIIDVAAGTAFNKAVPISFPPNVVQGSQRITVSVAGDLLGPVFENIDDLLRMPYGCGEQNMLYFAPNVFLIDYLQTTKTYTTELAATAENYMLIGYQKEIQYQHNDGSYSAFGQNDRGESGSMWLTAFVTKCFVQSMALQGQVISIDPKLLHKSIMWMVSQQNKDGSFPEPGKVFNKNMQGGSAQGEALTAYVLIALAETESNFKALEPADKLTLQASITRARVYLEQQLSNLTDAYDVAIVSYALHLTDSASHDAAFERLRGLAVTEPLTLHWERPKPATETTNYYSWERTTDAINIEATAYALLTYMKRNNVPNALPIVRWLTSQRGPQGGFISTQDTVTGLQALAEVAAAIYTPTQPPITVTIQWTPGVGLQQETRSLTIDDSTKILLQQVEVPISRNMIPEQITINAVTTGEFSGIAVAEVTLDFNIQDTTTFNTYKVITNVRQQKPEEFVLRVEASRADGKQGSMTIVEVGVPTGFAVDTSNPRYDVTGSKQQEVKDRKYILYYDEMGSKPVRAVLPMAVASGVPVNLEPTPVLVYDYYEPGGTQQQQQSYELPLLKSNSICDRQPDYESCAFIKRASQRQPSK